MPPKKSLLINFRENNSLHGVTRETLRELADKLGVTETVAAHTAIRLLHTKLCRPEDVDFDYPSDEEAARLAEGAGDPSKGTVVSSLFPLIGGDPV